MLRPFVAASLLIVPWALLGGACALLRGWALYTEADVLDANVLHPLFATGKHFAEAHWQPSMRQRERLDSIGSAVHWAAQALDRAGVRVFLESSSLIGWLRHGGHIPWETDADLGMLVEDCRHANATKTVVEQAARKISEDLVVLKFACSCEEHCEGEDRRMVGQFAHRRTGVTVDIFSYAPVQQLRPWQQAVGAEWWERVDDEHSDYTFPRDVLLPLQEGTFLGSPMLLPKDPREFLSWEYGGCLGVHVWPWRLLLYSSVLPIVPVAILFRSLLILAGLQSRWSMQLAALGVVYAGIAVSTCGGGGVSLFLLLVWNFCELAAICIWPEGLLGGIGQQSRHCLVILFVIITIVFALRGSLEQLICHATDYITPRRPKTSTICLFGKCWDF